MMRLFDAYVAVDWSASSSPAGKTPRADALWVGERLIHDGLGITSSTEQFFRTRSGCKAHLLSLLKEHVRNGRRVFIGLDFGYGYPAGFAEACGLRGTAAPWRLVWDELEQLIEDRDDNSNNRFRVASALNARVGGELPGPFWGCHGGIQEPNLQPKGATYPYATGAGPLLQQKRETERLLSKAQPTWKLWGAGSVGGQTLLGIPAVATLRDHPELRAVSRVWPFETGFSLESAPPGTPFVLHAEIWPGVVEDKLDPSVPIRDQAQVRAMTEWLAELDTANDLLPMLGRPAGLSDESLKQVVEEEGWIFGSGP